MAFVQFLKRFCLLFLPLLACSSRMVPDKPPVTSAASPLAPEAALPRVTVILSEDPPVSGENDPNWRGLGSTHQAEEPSHSHHRPARTNEKKASDHEQQHEQHQHAH